MVFSQFRPAKSAAVSIAWFSCANRLHSVRCLSIAKLQNNEQTHQWSVCCNISMLRCLGLIMQIYNGRRPRLGRPKPKTTKQTKINLISIMESCLEWKLENEFVLAIINKCRNLQCHWQVGKAQILLPDQASLLIVNISAFDLRDHGDSSRRFERWIFK